MIDIIQDEFTPKPVDLPTYDFSIPDYSVPTVKEQGETDFFESLANSSFEGLDKNGITLDERKRYNDPFLSYVPGEDNEDIYAKIKPFTWGDSFKKAGATLGVNLLSNFRNALGAVASLNKGADAIWDNEYANHMVEATKALEEMYPQYKTKDERDNPFAIRNLDSTLKSILPATGTVASGIIDMVVGQVALQSLGAVTGGATNALGAAKFLKDTNKIANSFKGIYSAFKASTVGRGLAANKQFYDNYKGLVVGGLFYANGEAALQGAMNSQDFYDKQIESYYKTYGKMPTGKALEDLEKKVQGVGRSTFLANLALIGGSNIIQFPNLIQGTVKESLLDNSMVKLVNGELTKRSFLERTRKNAPGVIGDSFSEGFEEFGQGVIDKTFQDYYGTDQNFVKSINKSLLQSFNQEGLLEFAGGALIGGGVQIIGNNFKAATGYTSDAINQFNSSTREYLDSAQRLNTAGEDLDSNLFKVAELARVAKATNTQLARIEHLKDLRDMDNEAFKEYTKLDLSPEEQKVYTNKTLNEFNKALSLYDAVHEFYDFNPLTKDKSILQRVSDIGNKYFKDEKGIEVELWNDFRNLQFNKHFKIEMYNDRVNQIASKLQDSSILEGNLENVINNWKVKTSSLDKIKTESDLTKALPKLPELTGDVKKDFISILKYEGLSRSEINRIKDYKSILQDLQEDISKVNSEAGLKQELHKILTFKENNFNEEVESTPVELKEEVPPTPEEDHTVEGTEVAKESTDIFEPFIKSGRIKSEPKEKNTVYTIVPNAGDQNYRFEASTIDGNKAQSDKVSITKDGKIVLNSKLWDNVQVVVDTRTPTTQQSTTEDKYTKYKAKYDLNDTQMNNLRKLEIQKLIEIEC